MTRRSVIHIVNGSAAAGTLRRALGLEPSALLVSHDLYSCGPLLPMQSLVEWRQAREGWWAQRSAEQGNELSKDLFDQFDIVDHVDALRDCETIRLWIGVGLGDQTFLVWLPQLLRIAGIAGPRPEIVQYDRVAGFYGRVIGIGILNEEQIRAHPEPVLLKDDDLQTLDRAWSALTASEPDALIFFLSNDRERLPLLWPSMQSLLRRYPDSVSGLGIWDRAALECTSKDGPKAVRVVAAMMTYDLEQPDWPGDFYLYSRMQRLSDPKLAHPLLSLAPPNKGMRETTVEITEAGRAVLNGEANAVELNGINDWVAGVHLDSKAGRVWFHRDGELVAAG